MIEFCLRLNEKDNFIRIFVHISRESKVVGIIKNI